jgi:uncharacterized protein
MAINSQKLNDILKNFVALTADIEGVAVVTLDGLPLAFNLPDGMDEERVSTISAVMLSLGDRIGVELARGEIHSIYMEGKEGFSILTSGGEEAIFLVLASKTAKQGVLMLEIKRVIASIKPELS